MGAATAIAVALLAAIALIHTDEIRARADAALGAGMPPREAALARGFVLGQDEQVDAATVDDFRRSGLSHLLAVSGQNVALLALLATPLLAALGLPLRARLLWTLGLIAVYVPLAGAAPSIQRAGVMGAVAVLGTLLGRRSSRLYSLALAAAVTVAVDPGVVGQPGWQLSFAAVLGIVLLAAPAAALIRERLALRGPLGRAVAEGAAMTAAATLATAPLIAFHFGQLSLVSPLANLLALPAVAPAMWLGMLAAAAGQVPGLSAAPLNLLTAPLLAYIAEIANWCARPAWACLSVRLDLAGLVASYAVVAVALAGASSLLRRRRVRQARSPGRRRRGSRRPAAAALVLLLLVAAAASLAPPGPPAGLAPPTSGLRVSVLDVGQGDAILLQPARAAPVLVDGGPPGDGLVGLLRSEGVGGLGAVIVTHDQSDHTGGVRDLLGAMPVRRLLYAVAGRRLLGEALAAGAEPRRIASGDEVRAGELRLDAIWPPTDLLSGVPAGADPNALAIVLVAHWRRFSMLLSADAEAESTPIDPGPIDVLKVAHHGSEDAGLGDLLDRTRPRLAVISVGADNPYGHPTAATLATLRAHHVAVLRTDRDGTIELDLDGGSLDVSTRR